MTNNQFKFWGNLRIRVTKLLILSALLAVIAACGEKPSESSNPVEASQDDAIVEDLIYPLKVKDIGLGLVKVPCTPKEETYVDILQKPVRLQLECSIGSSIDKTDIVFASDGRTVVRVTRNQYLTPSDPEPGDVVNAAIKFYGNPKDISDGNWIANYGDAYTVTYNGNRADSSLNDAGIGLLIKGYICADGNYGTVDCGGGWVPL